MARLSKEEIARRDELLARGYKHCTKCDKTRPVAEFSKNRRRRDGLSYMCRWCSSEYAADYYEQNREEERAVCVRAYRVGAALAWLVQRMETFCGATDGDVLIYKRGDRSRIPERIPATAVLHAQARNYSQHRDLYPDEHQTILDGGLAGILADPENAATAREGFLAALSTNHRGENNR
jgi:hypothetical protein